MSEKVVLLISWIALALLAVTSVVFVVMTVRKARREKSILQLKSKETWFLFLPILLVNWALYFIGLETSNDMSVTTNLIWSISFALKSFGFSFGPDDVGEFVMQFWAYRAAFNIAGLLAQVSVVLFALVLFFSIITKRIKYAKFLVEDAYVLTGDEEYIEYYLKNLGERKKDKNILIFLDGEAKLLRKYDGGNVILEEGKKAEKFLAWTLSKGKKERTVYFASLYKKDDVNIRLAAAVTDLLRKNEGGRVKIQAAFRSDRRHNHVIHESSVKIGESNVYFFKSGTLIANDFSLTYPFAKDLPKELIDRENALLKKGVEVGTLFIGMGEANYHILKNSLSADLFYGHAYRAKIYDILDGEQVIDELKVNTFNIFEKENVDGAIAPLEDEFIITAEKVDAHTESFLKKVSDDVKNWAFTRAVVNLGDVAMNISVAIAIRNRLRKEKLSDKCILYVGVGDGLYQSYSKLVAGEDGDAKVLPLGEEGCMYTEELIWKTDIDVLAKKINAFYCQDADEEESWNSLDYFTKNSNRSVAYNLRNKFNMLGFDIEKGAFDEAAFKAFEESYQKGSARENLAKEEHLRWNSFSLANGWKPMKKGEIVIENGLVKMKNPVEKKHACLTSIDGLDLLAEYGKELGEKYGLSQKAVNKTDTFRFDFTVMDNVKTILQSAGYTVKKL